MTDLKRLTIEELNDLKETVSAEIKLRESQDVQKVIIDLPDFDSRHKRWIKKVTGVDGSKSDGYAFQGNFLQVGSTAELPVGTILMYFYGSGSAKNHTIEVRIHLVTPDGLEDTGISTSRDNRKSSGWALDIRDKVAELFS